MEAGVTIYQSIRSSLDDRFERLKILCTIWESAQNSLTPLAVQAFMKHDMESLMELMQRRMVLSNKMKQVKGFIDRWEVQNSWTLTNDDESSPLI